jgi:hypothetical protein
MAKTSFAAYFVLCALAGHSTLSVAADLNRSKAVSQPPYQIYSYCIEQYEDIVGGLL